MHDLNISKHKMNEHNARRKKEINRIMMKETFMRSRAKIFRRNGKKWHFKAVVQKYSQDMAEKQSFRKCVQKNYPGWGKNICFKINIHPCTCCLQAFDLTRCVLLLQQIVFFFQPIVFFKDFSQSIEILYHILQIFRISKYLCLTLESLRKNMVLIR